MIKKFGSNLQNNLCCASAPNSLVYQKHPTLTGHLNSSCSRNVGVVNNDGATTTAATTTTTTMMTTTTTSRQETKSLTQKFSARVQSLAFRLVSKMRFKFCLQIFLQVMFCSNATQLSFLCEKGICNQLRGDVLAALWQITHLMIQRLWVQI